MNSDFNNEMWWLKFIMTTNIGATNRFIWLQQYKELWCEQMIFRAQNLIFTLVTYQIAENQEKKLEKSTRYIWVPTLKTR